jgi:arylsulfatase A-like enzyme
MYDQLGRRSAPSVTDALLDWLDHDRERPFFAFVNYFDAHAPYLPPAPFDAAFGPSVTGREPIVIEELNRRTFVEPEILQNEIDAYDGGIAYLDDHVGALLDEMDRRGLLGNTVVIISSDHGEELGEHGHFGHASGFFHEAIRVPLLLFGPGIPEGVRVQTPVSLRNIGATITELAGFEGANFPGTSLARYWRDPNAPGDTVLTEHEGLQSLYTDRYHFLQDPWDDSESLFDIRLDPAEQHDLLGTPEAATVMPGILQTLRALAAKPEAEKAVEEPVPVKN